MLIICGLFLGSRYQCISSSQHQPAMLMMINDVPDLCVVWEPGSSQADTHDPGETVEMINWFKLIQTTLRSALHYVTCKRKDAKT